VLDAASKPLDSASWLAAVTVATDRIGATGELGVLGRAGWDEFAAAVRAQLGDTRWYSVIVRAVFDAATDPAHAAVGVTGQRAGVLERVAFALSDLAARRAEITEVEARMLRVLDQLDLTELVSSIPGVSAVGAATILAETGDPTRFSSARALVKHAGLCPRDNSSGGYQGKTAISGRGRPELRLAAWRAVFGALHHNPVLAARHAHLTGRTDNPLTDTQARIAVAASLLRQLHAVIVTRTAWDPAIAAGLDRRADHENGAATAA
jgi:transposase